MTPTELKQWQADLGLSEAAMAAYIGVPVHTYRGWIKGTRKPDAAPMRLMHLLQTIEKRAPVLHMELVNVARESVQPARGPGRHRRLVGTWPAPDAADSGIPEWMRISAMSA